VLISDADRLAMIQAVGEQVDVDGVSTWVVWQQDLVDAAIGLHSSGAREVQITGRSPDLKHLTKDTVIVRAGASFVPIMGTFDDDGVGTIAVRLKKA